MDKVILKELCEWFSHLEKNYTGLDSEELKESYINFFNIHLDKKMSPKTTKNKVKTLKKEKEPLDDEIRCIAIKKDGGRCTMRKLKMHDEFCMSHVKNKPSKTINDEDSVDEEELTPLNKKKESLKTEIDESLMCIALKKDNNRCTFKKAKDNDEFCLSHCKKIPKHTINSPPIEEETDDEPVASSSKKDKHKLIMVQEEDPDEVEVDYTEEDMA